jgi:hypothetical protein
MRFTPALFASAAAASVYGGGYDWDVSSSSVASSSTPVKPVLPSTSSKPYGGYYASSVASSSSTPVKPVLPSKSSSVSKYPVYTTSTIYSTIYSTYSSKVYTTKVPVSTTICPYEEEDEYYPSSTSSAKKSSSTPVKPIIPITASSTTPIKPVYPVTSSTPVYPVYGSSSYIPYGTGSPVKPSPYQFTGAAVAQKAGAVLAGAGAVAAMLL